jgi:hypothetical protein
MEIWGNWQGKYSARMSLWHGASYKKDIQEKITGKEFIALLATRCFQ